MEQTKIQELEQMEKKIEEASKRIRDVLDEYDCELWVDILRDSTGNLTNSERALLSEIL